MPDPKLVTIKSRLQTAAKFLDGSGVGSARLDAELLMAYVLRKQRPWLIAHSEDELPAALAIEYDKLIVRRSQRTPLVHLTGAREFYGLDLKISPSVLTPRVETEIMVDWALELAPKNSVLLDVGTGSGAIAIAIAKHRPDLHITATEVSETALEIATFNQQAQNVNIQFVFSDLLDDVVGIFDTIVCNLPYLADNADLMPEVQKEPAVALFGGPDGLDLYRRFFGQLAKNLAPGGLVLTESDPWQHEALTAIAATAGLSPLPDRSNYFIMGYRHDNA